MPESWRRSRSRRSGLADLRVETVSLRGPMQIGVPKETAEGERRVALVPDAVRKLVQPPAGEDGSPGNEVIVQRGAGSGALIPDAQYEEAGATMADGPE